jgi:hypothetical protein
MVAGVLISEASPFTLIVAPSGSELMLRGTDTGTVVVAVTGAVTIVCGTIVTAGRVVVLTVATPTDPGLKFTAAAGIAARRKTRRRMQRSLIF